MVDKQKLKERQPVAWRILSNALKSGHISHAYMFYGQKGPDQSRMALLFAQSLVCEHPDEDGFACQQCDTCRQMEREISPDFYWLHPGGTRSRKPMTRKELDAWWKNQTLEPEKKKTWRLRKEDIQNLQDTFSYTSSTTTGRQIYLIEQYEEATASASNTLLKFLEEPKDNLTGILCTGAINMVLPTIVSRCQLIPLRAPARSALEEQIGELIEDEELVSILAKAGYDNDRITSLLEGEALFEIRQAAHDYWNARSTHGAIVRLETGVFAKGAFGSREAVVFFLNCLLYFAEQENRSDIKALEERTVLLESIDAMRLPLDPLLLVERTARDLKRISQRR